MKGVPALKPQEAFPLVLKWVPGRVFPPADAIHTLVSKQQQQTRTSKTATNRFLSTVNTAVNSGYISLALPVDSSLLISAKEGKSSNIFFCDQKNYTIL